MRSPEVTHHGHHHRPGGADPAETGPWHKITSLTTGTGRVWYKLIVGRTGSVTQTLELIVAVDDGSALTNGDVIATLDAGYFDFCDGENTPGQGHDSTGALVVFYVDFTNGNIVYGPVP